MTAPNPYKPKINCADAEPEIFFLWETRSGISKTRAATLAFELCFACPLRVECVLLSLRVETGVLRSGIWGGTTPAERRAMVRRGITDEWSVMRELARLDQRPIDRRVSVSKVAGGDEE